MRAVASHLEVNTDDVSSLRSLCGLPSDSKVTAGDGAVPGRLHELHESKFPFVSRIEFIRSKLSNFSAHVYGVIVCEEPERLYRTVAPPASGLHRQDTRCAGDSVTAHMSFLPMSFPTSPDTVFSRDTVVDVAHA